MVTHQLQVERRTGKVRPSKTDVLPTVPRNQPSCRSYPAPVILSVYLGDLFGPSLPCGRHRQYAGKVQSHNYQVQSQCRQSVQSTETEASHSVAEVCLHCPQVGQLPVSTVSHTPPTPSTTHHTTATTTLSLLKPFYLMHKHTHIQSYMHHEQ